MTRTIRRNATHQLKVIQDQDLECHLYSLGTNFKALKVDIKFAWEELHRYSFSRLIENRPGYWTVRVHGNRWYELRTREVPDAED